MWNPLSVNISGKAKNVCANLIDCPNIKTGIFCAGKTTTVTRVMPPLEYNNILLNSMSEPLTNKLQTSTTHVLECLSKNIYYPCLKTTLANSENLP